MPSLTTCLKKHGNAIPSEDIDLIKKIAAEVGGKDGAVQAVQEVLDIAMQEHAELVARIEKAGGNVPSDLLITPQEKPALSDEIQQMQQRRDETAKKYGETDALVVELDDKIIAMKERQRTEGVKDEGDQYNLFTDMPLPKSTQGKFTQVADEFYVHYEQVPVSDVNVGIDQVTDAADAAHIVAPFRKHAQETMLALVVDKDGKVLNLIRHTKGLAGSSTVSSSTLVGAIAATRGAHGVWLAHNHPSGNINPSKADMRITRIVADMAKDVGIKVQGHVVVAEGGAKYSLIGEDGATKEGGKITPSRRNKKIAVTERVIRKRGAHKENINASSKAALTIDNTKAENGILLTNAKNDLVGIISLTKDEMSALRPTKAPARIIAALSKSGAINTIPFTKTGGPASLNNLLTFLNTHSPDVRVIDAFAVTELGAPIKSLSTLGYSLSGNADGTFLSRSKAQDEEPKISVLHNLTEDNLLFADRMGGLAAPSLAITNPDTGIEEFGDITLIGREGIINPQIDDVHTADSYSSRWPKAKYKKRGSSIVMQLIERLRPWSEKYDGDTSLSLIFDYLVNYKDARVADAVQTMLNSNAAKAMFLYETTGKKPRPMYKNKRLQIIHDKETVKYVKENKDAIERSVWSDGDAATLKKLSDMVLAEKKAELADIYEASGTITSREEAIKLAEQKITDGGYGHLFDEDGLLTPHNVSQALRDAENYNKKEPDSYGMRERLGRQLKGKEGEYKEWVESQVLDVAGDAYVEIGRKKLPYTMENILVAMTRNGTKNQEDTMTFGPGRIKATASKQMTSMDEIKNRSKWELATTKEAEKAQEKSEKLLSDFREKVADYYAYSDAWSAFDDAMLAVARYAQGRLKGNPKTILRQELSKLDFKGVPDSLIELGVKAGDAVIDAPIPYFEAKPHRIITFDAFAGAVVPKNTSKQAIEVLERHGITVQKYANKTRDSQEMATIALRKKLARKGEPVLFKKSADKKKTPMSTASVSRVVGRINHKLLSTRKVVVVDHFTELPDAALRDAAAQGSDGTDIQGIYHKGTIYIVADQMDSELDVETVLFHEASHKGLAAMFGDPGVKQAMNKLFVAMGGARGMNRMADKFGVNIDAYRKGVVGKKNIDAETRNTILIEELLAHIAEKGDGSLKQKALELIGAIRAWLRKNGFIRLAKINAADVASIAKNAREAGLGTAKAGGDTRLMVVFHGTHADNIDQFSTDYIGTGEGKQAYGWGLYFASNKEVAEHYKTSVSQRHAAQSKGALYQVELAPKEDEYLLWDKPLKDNSNHVVASVFKKHGLSDKEIADIVKARHDEPKGRKSERYNYWEGILVDPADAVFVADLLETKGEAIYYGIVNEYLDKKRKATDKDRSIALHNLGVRGIKYLDAGSRGTSAVVWASQSRKTRYPDGTLRYAKSALEGVDFNQKEAVKILRSNARRKQGTELGKAYDGAARAIESGSIIIKEPNYNYVIFNDQDVEISARLKRKETTSEFEEENRRLREQDKTLWDRAKIFLRRQLAPGGNLPRDAFSDKIIRDSNLEADEFDIQHVVGQLERSIKSAYGKTYEKLDEDTRQAIDESLHGRVNPDLDDAVKEKIIAMRQHIDNTSVELTKTFKESIATITGIDLSVVNDILDKADGDIETIESDLKDAMQAAAVDEGKKPDMSKIGQAMKQAQRIVKILSNLGIYVNRSYRAFDDPKWFRKLPDDVIDDAREYLRLQYEDAGYMPNEAAEQAERVLYEIVKTDTAYDSMEAFIKESKLGKKDLSMMIKRKDIAPEIRALLGEYQDARLLYAKSITKMSRLIWNHRFLEHVLKKGKGVYLFERNEKPPEATVKIAAEGNETMMPLDGLWTTPEVNQAFIDALGKENMANWYRTVVQANGMIKMGKAQPLDATIFTPSGPVKMRDIRVGDKVCGYNVTTTVTGVFPQGKLDIYRFTFNDGSTTEASRNHLWEVNLIGRTAPSIMTTKELLDLPDHRFEKRQVSIPVSVAEFAQQDVEIDPYLLGIILADGCTRRKTPSITMPDAYIVNRVTEALGSDFDVLSPPSWNNIDYSLVYKGQGKENLLSRQLKDLGVWEKLSHEKHIPKQYLFNSIEVRKELARGLLDGDGWVTKDGQPEYTTSSKQLAKDFAFLAESLGATTITRSKVSASGRIAYAIAVRCDNASDWFSLPRKKDKATKKKKPVHRTLISIEPVGKKPCQCIMVEDERSLYLTDRFIVTHNTVLSPTTAARNWQSALFFSLANGHFDLRQAKISLAGLKEYFTHNGDQAKLAYLRKLKKLGVVYDNPYAQEMMRLIDDSRMEDVLLARKGKFADSLRWIMKNAKSFYSYGDDFWKIIGFENEKRNFMKHAGLSEEQAEIKAAERIRNVYPTYSMVGRGIQQLRRFPLAGTFVSFPAEIIRTSYHIVKYMAEDMKTPGMRPMALRRAAGIAIVGGFAHALQSLSMAALGVDDEEEEAIRDLAAPWQKNSNLWFTGRDEKGRLRYFDISFLDPYNYWKRPINAALRDQDWRKALVSATEDALSPFLGTDIAAGALFEIFANKKRSSGAPVFFSHDDITSQVYDISRHLRKAIQPGVVSNLERSYKALAGKKSASGRVYSVSDEAAAWGGWRSTTVDPKLSLFYRSYEFKDAKRQATTKFNKVMRNPNRVSKQKIMDAYAVSKRLVRSAYEEYSRIVHSAKKSGLSDEDIRRILRRSGISKKDVEALLTGKIPDWKPTKASMRNALKKAEAIFDEATRADFEKRYRMIIEGAGKR